jgi:hypothetical protein
VGQAVACLVLPAYDACMLKSLCERDLYTQLSWVQNVIGNGSFILGSANMWTFYQFPFYVFINLSVIVEVEVEVEHDRI